MQAGEVVRMGPCGGGGGNARKIGMVGEVRRIVQVAVRHCRAVHAIRVTYMWKDREETELWGRYIQGTAHSGDGKAA